MDCHIVHIKVASFFSAIYLKRWGRIFFISHWTYGRSRVHSFCSQTILNFKALNVLQILPGSLFTPLQGLDTICLSI